MPKYIIYSFRDNNNSSYLCILDKDCANTGYQRNTYYKKRLSKKLINSLLPDCYPFVWFRSYKVSTKHEEIFNSDNRRELIQTLEGYNIEVYYEIP